MVIIGKGGLGREVASYCSAKNINFAMTENEDIESYMKYPMYQREALIAIGDGNIRKKIVEQYDFQWIMINFGSTRSHDTTYGEGTVVCPGTITTVNVKLGKHVFVNLNCTIGHDVVIGDYTTLSPGVNVSGNVTIGQLCYIGSNAVIKEKINICDQVTIGAGAVVVKNITEPGTYVGNPAKKIV